jgi:hypothetical protein
MSAGFDFQKTQFFAVGAVTGATGAKLSGGANVATARTGAGVYTLTTAQAVPAAESVLIITNNTAAGQIQGVHTSDTVKTVTSFAADGTTATDKNFSYLLAFVIPS